MLSLILFQRIAELFRYHLFSAGSLSRSAS